MGDLDKFIIAKGLKSCPKSNMSPNLVTLMGATAAASAARYQCQDRALLFVSQMIKKDWKWIFNVCDIILTNFFSDPLRGL